MNINKFYSDIKENINILGITSNSKEVKEGYIFVCIKGKKYDGNDFIYEALANKASYIVTSLRIKGNNIIHVKDTKKELIRLLQVFYDYSNNKIYTVGVTGTDGKTTVSTILNKIFLENDSSAYIGTNGIDYFNRHYKTINTLPDPKTLYSSYNIFNNHKINKMVMEVSSEGIKDKRIYNLKFDGAIYTNLSHEHLNAHHFMFNYFLCKCKLFKNLDNKGLIIANIDDSYFKHIKYHTKAKIVSYGLKRGDYQAREIDVKDDGSSFTLYYMGVRIYRFHTLLFGIYNIYNLLACIAYSYEIGIDLDTINNAIKKIDNIDGRFIKHRINHRTFIIDYAHTPNGLENLLFNVKNFTKGKIILVIGSQGLKDKSKRHLLGKISVKYSNIVIFTSEDPKNESIFNIFLNLTKDLNNKDYYLTLSRYEAIKLAYSLSSINDTIVIVGKGNEKYEYILDYKFHHNDLDIVYKVVKNHS